LAAKSFDTGVSIDEWHDYKLNCNMRALEEERTKEGGL
jgi:hypothetical protein